MPNPAPAAQPRRSGCCRTQDMEEKGRDSSGEDITSFRRGPESREMAIEEYSVDWDGPAAPRPRLRLLLLADVDLASAGRVVEWAIAGEKVFDMCAVCGDFIPRPTGWVVGQETEEQLSAEEGEISATLAQLENTVCRVVYIPGPLDPIIPSIRDPRRRLGLAKRIPPGARGLSPLCSAEATAAAAAAAAKRDMERSAAERVRVTRAGGSGRREEGGAVQLTPTSKNLQRRRLRLAPGLYAAGFTEEAEEGQPSRHDHHHHHHQQEEGGEGNAAAALHRGEHGLPSVGARATGTPSLPLPPPPHPSPVGRGGGGRGGEGGGGAEEDPAVIAIQALGRSSKARVGATGVGRSSAGGSAGRGGGSGGDSGSSSKSSSSRKKGKSRSTTPDEAVILLTRLGGARVRNGATTAPPESSDDDDDNDYIGGGGRGGRGGRDADGGAGGGAGAAPATAAVAAAVAAEMAAADRLKKATRTRKQQEAAVAAASAAVSTAEAARAAALLKLLWAIEDDRRLQEALVSGEEEQGGGGGSGGGGGVLLHACAGPGALSAVRGALARGAESVTAGAAATVSEPSSTRGCTTEGVGERHGGSSSSSSSDPTADVAAAAPAASTNHSVGREEAGRGDGGGLGCRIGECTVTALGSLREDGAFCVVELDMPTAGGGGRGGGGRKGWSVASVEFGNIDVGLGERETERLFSLGRGNFVLNFE